MISRDDVITAYELILARPPESEAVIEMQCDHPDRASFGKALLRSDEAQSRLRDVLRRPVEVHPALTERDMAVFGRFPHAGGPGEPGFIRDFLGVRTSTRYSPTFAPHDGKVFDAPLKADFHAEAPEWLGLLKSVLSASGSYRILEIGAGYGPWLAAGHAAARRHGIGDILLYGLEADPGRYAFLREHMVQNGIDPAACRLINAAIGSEDGTIPWPVSADAAADYGSRPLDADGQDYRGHAHATVIDLPMLGMTGLLEREPSWDLVHVDIQGLETDVCGAALETLDARVRWLVIGTHSRKIDGDLLEMFWRHGWVLEHEQPSRFNFSRSAKNLEAMTVADGAQVWRNPRLVPDD
ncbi:class I SAM-dependent methyltransferase [Roseomonas gilardii]|uniref:hypothetical protein n=1 Tax=Roseomonas gilardii TaxID=257708 RepID=UPI0004833083|nr:hypothetical protein [Roseomonas gilardii]SUE43444.1 methyltransferase, FkbM family [Roseomonas gilardii subsp. rosea]